MLVEKPAPTSIKFPEESVVVISIDSEGLKLLGFLTPVTLKISGFDWSWAVLPIFIVI
jgi:hypothetical protein